MRGWRSSFAVVPISAIICLITLPATGQESAAQPGATATEEAGRLTKEVARLQEVGKHTQAVPFAERALALFEKALPPEHPDVARAIDNLVAAYRAAGLYANTEPLLKRAIALSEKVLGPGHPDLATDLSNLATLYVGQARHREAEALYRRGLAIDEKALGPNHVEVAIDLNNLAALYRAQFRHGEAEPLYKRSLAIRKSVLGPDHPDVAQSYNNLAALYQSEGRHAEAEASYKRALSIDQKAQGHDHPDVATGWNNLAMLYLDQGRLAEAEPLLKRSLSLREKVFGSSHPDVGTSLNNLAELYRAQDRNAEAEPLLERSLAVREKALGPDHRYVWESLNNLAALYQDQGRHGEALSLYERSLSMSENRLGPEHPEMANKLGNLASLHQILGHADEAEALYKRSLSIRERALTAGHPDLGLSLNNLGALYVARNRAEAEALLERGLSIRLKALGPDHPDVAQSLNNLAWLSLTRNDPVGAAAAWSRAVAILRCRAERGLPGDGGGGSAKGEAQRNSSYFIGLIKSTYRAAAGQTSKARELAAPTTCEARRGQAAARAEPSVPEAMFDIAQWAQGSEAAAALAQMAVRSAAGRPELAGIIRKRQEILREWIAKDRQLISAKGQPPDERDGGTETALSDRLRAIEAELQRIDARLAKEFPDYSALSSPKPITASDVQQALSADEALVLFLDTDARFPGLSEETFVWAVTKTEVRLASVKSGTRDLGGKVAALRCGLDDSAWKGDGALRCRTLLQLEKRPAKDDPLPFSTGISYELYETLFGQVADLIKGKHLIIVPSGALTRLPFQVLVTEPPPSEGFAKARWLARDHAITILPAVASLGALRRVGRPSAAKRPMIGFGNPLLDGLQADKEDGATYKERAELARSKTSCTAPANLRTSLWRGFRRGPEAVPQSGGLASLDYLRVQPPLPETADELCAVARDLKADVREIRIGARATETEVKRLSASGDLARYRIVHFATHGTLAGELRGTSEPGLLLTPPATATAGDDGYLAASEIAGLKLDADWVILSACNTAGAEAKGEAAEALSGLARAFIYAGARALLVSHWPVDSDVTVKLISTAARESTGGARIGRAEALRRAMLALIDSADELERHPANWAPFVLVGEGGAGR